MKVLITGSDGQLGYELQRSAPEGYALIAVDRDKLDITNLPAVLAFCEEHRLGLIINAAAYTAVDKAEDDTDAAYAVNEQGAAHLAQAAKVIGARMVQVSTDFVFSGAKSSPYLPEDKAEATGVYGASKHAGDQAVLEMLGDQAIVLRTSWLYSAHGNNFVKTMLRLMQEREELGIVADQVGTPTWAATLADCIWQLIQTDASGIYHCADNGVASWYDFAVAIQEEALAMGLLEKGARLKAIRTGDYPTAAKRPAYSVMDKSKTEQQLQRILPDWRVSLQKMLKEFKI